MASRVPILVRAVDRRPEWPLRLLVRKFGKSGVQLRRMEQYGDGPSGHVDRSECRTVMFWVRQGGGLDGPGGGGDAPWFDGSRWGHHLEGVFKPWRIRSG